MPFIPLTEEEKKRCKEDIRRLEVEIANRQFVIKAFKDTMKRDKFIFKKPRQSEPPLTLDERIFGETEVKKR